MRPLWDQQAADVSGIASDAASFYHSFLHFLSTIMILNRRYEEMVSEMCP